MNINFIYTVVSFKYNEIYIRYNKKGKFAGQCIKSPFEFCFV